MGSQQQGLHTDAVAVKDGQIEGTKVRVEALHPGTRSVHRSLVVLSVSVTHFVRKGRILVHEHKVTSAAAAASRRGRGQQRGDCSCGRSALRQSRTDSNCGTCKTRI